MYVVQQGRQEQGFTLIEILIVVFLIAVLAGIAILFLDPFQDVGDEACHRADTAIEGVKDAAAEAGIEPSGLDTPEPLDCPED